MIQPGFGLRRAFFSDLSSAQPPVNRRRPVQSLLPHAPIEAGKNMDGGDAVPPDWSGDLNQPNRDKQVGGALISTLPMVADGR